MDTTTRPWTTWTTRSRARATSRAWLRSRTTPRPLSTPTSLVAGRFPIPQAPTTNTGTIEATGGGTLDASTAPIVSGGMLTGGTWIVGSNSTMNRNAPISTLAATVILHGPGASFTNLGTVNSITSAGELEIDGGLAFSTSGDLSNSGTISLEPGTLNVAGNYTQTAAPWTSGWEV